MALDNETIFVIIGLGLLLIIIVVVLVVARKFSKKALRPWLMKREKQSYESDRAHNSLVAVKAISKNFERQGIDVSEVERFIIQAEGAMELKDYSSVVTASERAKKLLIDLKKKKDREEAMALEKKDKTFDPTSKDFDTSKDLSYEPTSKEMLQKKYPSNYVESKFTIGLSERLLQNSKDKNLPVGDAEALLEKSKQCFDRENYDDSYRYALQCKNVLEGKKVEAETIEPEHVPEVLPKPEAIYEPELKSTPTPEPSPGSITALVCGRCNYNSKPGDKFCRRCGHKL